jgi:hypothetical protein
VSPHIAALTSTRADILEDLREKKQQKTKYVLFFFVLLLLLSRGV